MEGFVTYLNDIFGLSATAKPISQQELKSLPLFLSGRFELLKGSINQTKVLWAKIRDEVEFTPGNLKKQAGQLKSWAMTIVIFVFDELDSWQRKRLIERRINFLQTARQLFVPDILLELGDIQQRNKSTSVKTEALSFPAQLTILFHLQNKSVEHIALNELARLLNYTGMTVTRLTREFESVNLAKVRGSKEKYLLFLYTGKRLWEQAFPFLRSPVKEIWFYDGHFPTDALPGGQQALAEYSMLSQGNYYDYCLGKEKFRSMKLDGELPKLDKKYGTNRLEVWHYEPSIIAGFAAKTVDKLSLFLSMKNETDERLQAALNDMIKNMRW